MDTVSEDVELTDVRSQQVTEQVSDHTLRHMRNSPGCQLKAGRRMSRGILVSGLLVERSFFFFSPYKI